MFDIYVVCWSFAVLLCKMISLKPCQIKPLIEISVDLGLSFRCLQFYLTIVKENDWTAGKIYILLY